MRIALCDDCSDDLADLKKLILECELCPGDAQVYEYNSGEDLLKDFLHFDLIFLDMKLEGRNGIQTANHIRMRDPDVPIIFYTNYDISASKVIKIRPMDYLMKGSDPEKQKKIIYEVLQNICRHDDLPNLYVAYGGKTYILPLAHIAYISILDKGTEIWLSDEYRTTIFGETKKNQEPTEVTVKSGVKLDAYYDQLKSHGFIYAKKSYIINARFIIARFKDSVLLKGGYELSVARSKKKQFDDQLVEYWVNNAIGG